MTETTPFDLMQKAVDIVNNSAHPVNKIAAALSGMDGDDLPYSVAMTNYWPDRIHACFGADARIGNSSGTIHAETACILTAARTQDASLFVTDPFCPNCAKNMVEAGIKAVYIDHKGFAKDFADRRRESFDTLSLRICQKAGIAVYELHRKDERLTPIFEPPPGYSPHQDRPVTIEPVENGFEQAMLRVLSLQPTKRRFAAAVAHDGEGARFALTAFSHPSIGYTYKEDAAEIEGAQGKYTLMLEPVNRLLMNAARLGLKLMDGLIYSSQVPTAREQVNLIGAGLSKITIGNKILARDEESLIAMRMLEEKNVLRF